MIGTMTSSAQIRADKVFQFALVRLKMLNFPKFTWLENRQVVMPALPIFINGKWWLFGLIRQVQAKGLRLGRQKFSVQLFPTSNIHEIEKE